MSDELPPTGPGAAALLAAGVGSFALGAIVVAAEALPRFKAALNWWAPAGPLTGKVIVAVVLWAVSWAALHFTWRRKEVRWAPVSLWGSVLLALGFILTFPPVYEMFTRH